MNKIEYTQIFKLKKMLEEAKIPFNYANESWSIDYGTYIKHHIYYPSSAKTVCSCIQGTHTYGNKKDLLEIMGLLTKSEEKMDEVAGWLTAEEVFKRIKRHHKRFGKFYKQLKGETK